MCVFSGFNNQNLFALKKNWLHFSEPNNSIITIADAHRWSLKCFFFKLFVYITYWCYNWVLATRDIWTWCLWLWAHRFGSHFLSYIYLVLFVLPLQLLNIVHVCICTCMHGSMHACAHTHIHTHSYEHCLKTAWHEASPLITA